MATDKMVVRLKVRFAWWLWAYLSGVRFMADLTGLEPDMDKVESVARKAIKVVVQ